MRSGKAITLAISAACCVAFGAHANAGSGRGHGGGARVPGFPDAGPPPGHGRPDSSSQFSPRSPRLPLPQAPPESVPPNVQRRNVRALPTPTPRPKKRPPEQKGRGDGSSDGKPAKPHARDDDRRASHGGIGKPAEIVKDRRNDDSDPSAPDGRSAPDQRPDQTPITGAAPGVPSIGLNAAASAVPVAPRVVPEAPSNSSAANAQAETQSERHQRWNSLSEDERVKLKAALEKAVVDPEVRTVRDRLHEARREFRKVMRPALIKADPSVQPILEKVQAERAERDRTKQSDDD